MEDNQNRPKPNNYLVLAIVCTVLCCLPAGIVGIVYATKVNEAYAKGDYEGAERASKNAKTWSFVGIGVGVLVIVLYLAIFGFAILGGLANSGY